MITIQQAVLALDANAKCVVYGDEPTNEEEYLARTKFFEDDRDQRGNEVEKETPPFTWSEVSAKLAELKTAYDNNKYQRDRAMAYPSIQDQLDMQYHDAVDGTSTWKDAIAAVKSANPKP